MSEEIVTEKSFTIKVDGKGYNIRVSNPSQAEAYTLEKSMLDFQKEYNDRLIATYLGIPVEALKELPFRVPLVKARIMQTILEISGQAKPQPEDPYSSKEALGREQMRPENRKARVSQMMNVKMPQAEHTTVEES